MTSIHILEASPPHARKRSVPPTRRLLRRQLQAGLLGLMVAGVTACGSNAKNDAALVAQGKRTFRFDTFGDETKWTDALRMHEVIATASTRPPR